MADITKRFGIITGGTGSFGSIQHTDGDEMGTVYRILDSSRNLQFLTSVSASGDIQGGAGTFGSNVSVAGNLTVNGTTTTVNSIAIELGDRIINLNSSNASGDAGFYVNDTDTNQTGSMLWDSSADAWMGGVKDAEVHFVDLSSAQTLTNKTLTSPVISSGDINSPDIDGGTIDGATIATSDVTVGAGKTLDGAGTFDFSAGTLTLANDQISGDKVEGGTITATTITTLGSTTVNATTVNATTVDSTNLEVTNLKAKDGTAAGSIADSTGVVTLASSVLTTADINGGAIDGTVIGAVSAAAGTFAAVTATTMAATSLSASSFVSASSLTIGEDSATIDYSTSLDLSLGSTKYAALSTTHFSASVELQGPSMEVSGAAQVGSLTINGTALTATAAEINDLASNAVDGSDFTKLSNVTATAAELNYLDNDDLTAADITKLAAVTATAAEINDLTGNAVDASDFTKLSNVTATAAELNYLDNDDLTAARIGYLGAVTAGTAAASKAVVLGASGEIATIGTVGCGAITSTGASSFGASTLASLNNSSGGITNAGSIAGATSVDGSGDLTMGTITMSGFSVDADGDASAKSLVSTSTMSSSAGASASTLSCDGAATVGSVASTAGITATTVYGNGQGRFTSLRHYDSMTDLVLKGNMGGSSNLTIKGDSSAVLTAGNLTVGADLTVTGNDIKDSSNGAAITFDGSANTDIRGTLAASGHITLASGKDLRAADATCEIGSSGTKFAAGYFTNVYTGDMHLKNERGDWTIFEESDHLRIRNNATGQTFKMAMTPIEE